MSYFKELDEELKCYLEQRLIEKCYQAYLVAEKAHRGQMRRSGEPYITHPVAAALILARMRLDYQTIMATLLHDVVEDTSISKDDLTQQFGEDVTALVDGVTKLTKIKFESRAEAQAENFRKMVLSMADDIRVVLIKLADRLHNMRTLEYLSEGKRRQIAQETLEIYAPIAHRLGLNQTYRELQDLAFRHLHPWRYATLSKAVNKSRNRRRDLVLKEVAAFRPDALVIPAQDLHDAGRNPWVLMAEGGHARRRPVKVGLLNTGYAEILEGLKEGDLLLPASARLTPDARVRVRPRPPAR